MVDTLNLRTLTPGTRLRVRRAALGITQHRLAQLMGTHRPRICEAERGKAPPHLVERIEGALDQLMSGAASQRP